MPRRISPWWVVLSTLFVVLVALQAVPYGRNHTNPPVVAEPRWDSPETRAVVKQACFDCHSNETNWPWYSKVAPASWVLQHDVDAARAKLNFSEWRRGYDADDIEAALKRRMPLNLYSRMNAHARLGPSDRIYLMRGLTRTIELSEKQIGGR
jgi:hypothetical protein